MGLVSCMSDMPQTAQSPAASLTPPLDFAGQRAIVQEALFNSPEQCQGVCFWQLAPGDITREEFREVLLEIFPLTLELYRQDDTLPLAGLHTNGLAINGQSQMEPTAVVEHIRLTVYPFEAEELYDLRHVSPAGIVNHFGIPDDAFILLPIPGNDSFVIFLFYEGEAFIYQIRGTPQNQRLYLGLDDVEYVTLHRFQDSQAALEYIDFRTPNPPAERLVDHIQERLEDLSVLAQYDPFCLTFSDPR
jgi:hypothetical protein